MGIALTANLHGVLRDPRAMPVAGAAMRLIGAGRDEARSDGQGRFEIAWDRRCQLHNTPAFCLMAREERSNLATVVEVTGETSVLDVKLTPGTSLTGRIVDPNGRALTNAWVYVMLHVPYWGQTPLRDEQVRVDGDGRFEIPAVPLGRWYTLYMYADGYGSRDMSIDVQTAPDRGVDIGSVVLPPARLAVTGRVTDPRGYPLASAQVYGWGRGQPVKLSTQTDTEGRFRLAGVCEGRLDLRVEADLGGGNQLRAHVLAAAGDADLQITPLHLLRR